MTTNETNEIVSALRTIVEMIDNPGDNLILKALKGHLTNAADMIESLETQLAESQRRERAAVEDLRRFPGITPCHVCKWYIRKGVVEMHCKMDTRSCFEWRGPQE